MARGRKPLLTVRLDGLTAQAFKRRFAFSFAAVGAEERFFLVMRKQKFDNRILAAIEFLSHP